LTGKEEQQVTVQELRNCAMYMLIVLGFLFGIGGSTGMGEESLLRTMLVVMTFLLTALILAVLRLKDK